jgi:carbamate kinase
MRCPCVPVASHLQVPLPSPIIAEELEGMEFAKGSMGPKIQAAVDFVKATGGCAGIGNLGDAVDIVRGKKGTWIVSGAREN